MQVERPPLDLRAEPALKPPARTSLGILDATVRIISAVTEDERLARLEHRVCGLQTAVVAIIEHLGIEGHLAAAERARLDQSRFKGAFPASA